MIRSALALLTTALMAQTAWAAPVLRADVTVTAPVVTMADMFDDAGASAEAGLFRAPQPGTSGMVPVKDITAALARIGITEFSAEGLTSIRVSRAASVVDETTLTDLIAADLTNRGILGSSMTLDAIFSTPVEDINAEAVAQPASILSLRYLPGNGAFTARFAIAGVAEPLDVSGTIELMIAAPHITRNLPAGTLLTADNVQMRPVPVRFVESAGVARLEDVVGKTLTRQSREGMMLRPADVAVPLMVGKNDSVTIYFRKGPMTLTVKGQAITSAAEGSPVQVLNLMSKRVISATVIAPGAVEVGQDPLAVAGL
ncbi:flagella basal body P-ring formation protein FlgA [Devosia sp. YR412]|uniref:flagellar basal body P-ring formation chaperone FlgA n=1 Tax=Devosia sp. YR412 TaxID=1881030 RepID=UPI0008CB3D9B|nr:flagellar basal body P-ring formation chaperone FlgA [Devosia sp. YR412]SEP98642.1 flagella basal body P-ring formation protein FlgA [Devosia sp. YR412]